MNKQEAIKQLQRLASTVAQLESMVSDGSYQDEDLDGIIRNAKQADDTFTRWTEI